MNYWLYMVNISLSTWHFSELNSIITEAEQIRDIQTIVFFGSAGNIDRYIIASNGITIPKMVITQNYGDGNLKDITTINTNVMFVAVGSLEHKSRWNFMNDAFNGIQNEIRGIFITTRTNKNNFFILLQEHLEWCWQKGFTQVIVVVGNVETPQIKVEVFTYNPFFTDKIVNLTSQAPDKFFPDKLRNLNSYRIRTIALYDPPRVFERSQCIGKQRQILSGYVGNLFREFVNKYNGKYDLVQDLNNTTGKMNGLIQLLLRGEIELAINPHNPQKGTQLSYPIRMTQRCVVVPHAKELAKFKYFILPFENDVWLCFLGMWVIMSAARLIGSIFKHHRCHCSVLDVTKIFLDVWRQIIFLPCSGFCCSKSLYWFTALWFGHVFVLGFILSNLYLASLTSYFADLQFQRQISTLAELAERRIEIGAIDYEIPFILENRGLPKGFSDLLRPRPYSKLTKDIFSMRSDFSYTALKDVILFSLSQQKHLQKPISHMVSECISTVAIGFVMPPQSLFEGPLNRFMLRATSAGLIDKWIEESVQDALCSGILKIKKSLYHVTNPLELTHFQFGWYVLAGGYMVSLILFLLENLRRLTRRYRIFVVYY